VFTLFLLFLEILSPFHVWTWMVLPFFFIKDQYFFYRDGIFYGSSQVVNGLYILEMDN
jgi:hypothetical protein